MKRGLPLSTDKSREQPSFSGHPCEIVISLYGSEAVVLAGFEPMPMPGAWYRPSLRLISAESMDMHGIRTELDARARAVRLTRSATLLAFLVGALALAFWVGVGARPAPAEASSQWFVAGVGAQGVIVNSESVALMVSPGEMLPNGELLQAVIPERATYVTNHATVVLQPRPATGGAEPLPLPLQPQGRP